MEYEEEILNHYSYIWTTKKDEYFLVKTMIDGFYRIAFITQVPERVAGNLIIENDDSNRLVQKKMLEMDIPVIDDDEYDRIVDERLRRDKEQTRNLWHRLKCWIADKLKR